MTRTSNTLRVTFSANIGAGEGYLTSKSMDSLDDMIDDQGWLWAQDVFGDWKGEIERRQDCARASFTGWFDRSSPSAHLATDCKSAAQRLWERGVWPDVTTLNCYDGSGGIDPNLELDEYVYGPEFFHWMMGKARSDAVEIASALRERGPAYTAGKHPSYDDLVMFYLLSELSVGNDGAEKVLEDKRYLERQDVQR